MTRDKTMERLVEKVRQAKSADEVIDLMGGPGDAGVDWAVEVMWQAFGPAKDEKSH